MHTYKKGLKYHSQLAFDCHCEWTTEYGSTLSVLSLCLRPLSTDSCFLTKPTLIQADPVIMRLCPELQATREQCQQPGADLLNRLASPRSQKEQKLHLIVWVERADPCLRELPMSNTYTEPKQCRGLMCIHMCAFMTVPSAGLHM